MVWLSALAVRVHWCRQVDVAIILHWIDGVAYPLYLSYDVFTLTRGQTQSILDIKLRAKESY